MKSFYKLMCCICIAGGFLLSPFAKAGDTLQYTSRLKFRLTYPKNINSESTSYPRLRLNNQNYKGVGEDEGVAISFSGSFRFNAMYRALQESYPGVKPVNLNVGGFGDGTMPNAVVPLLTLYSKIVPATGVELGVGMAFNHIFTGSTDSDSTRNVAPFGQSFGGYANFKTSFGNVRIGGGNLYTGMSQLFSGWSQIRWNPFYRLPWDVSAQHGGSWSTYEGTFNNGSVTNFDAAYASGGRTQGAILQLSDLPAGFGLNLSYGVNGQTGLFQTNNTLDVVTGTKKTLGGRLYKKVNTHTFGVTGIVNNGYVDNISNYLETQYMYSGDAHLVFNNVTISTELGATEFTSPFGRYNGTTAGSGKPADTILYKSGVDYLGQVKVHINKKAFGFPVNFVFYNLGPNYINLNGGAFNTSTYNNAAAYIQVNSNWDVALRKGFIADIGQSANNRRAVELSTQLEKGRFKVSIGTQVGTDITNDTLNNQVMFYQKLNSWSRASFNYWTPLGGPYHKLLSNYMQLLEKVPITDKVVNYKKTYNVFVVDARYKTSLFGRSLIMANYVCYQSASDHFSPLPYVTDNAFVRVFYEELTAYYQLYKNTVIVGHVAYNKAVGNDRTALSPDNGKPIDQDTWGVGAGVDWNFAPNAGLYFREMWMSHRDKNFSLDHFKGFETTVELKVLF